MNKVFNCEYMFGGITIKCLKASSFNFNVYHHCLSYLTCMDDDAFDKRRFRYFIFVKFAYM